MRDYQSNGSYAKKSQVSFYNELYSHRPGNIIHKSIFVQRTWAISSHQ